MRTIVLPLLALGLSCSPAVAAGDLTGCYKRSYDAAHLARNPRQKVTVITVRVAPAPAGVDAPFSTDVDVTLRASKADWNAGGPCKPQGESLSCDFSDTGGGAMLARHGSGLKLEVTGEKGLGLEGIGLGGEGGERTFKYLTKPDDAVFLLDAAPPGTCEKP